VALVVDLRLRKLPQRAPVKLTISLSPELSRALDDYAAAYEAAYGEHETVAELVPFIIESFLRTDRAFSKSRKQKPRGQ